MKSLKVTDVNQVNQTVQYISLGLECLLQRLSLLLRDSAVV